MDDARATEAGLKYFVLGAVASGLLLYGASLVYGFAGTTNFGRFGPRCLKTPNMGRAPVWLWAWCSLWPRLRSKFPPCRSICGHRDVYEGAPTPVTAFFAVGPKIAALALFLRVLMGPFGELAGEWQQVRCLDFRLVHDGGRFGRH